MEAALKKEADGYFSSPIPLEEMHDKAADSAKMLHFYILLLAKYLPPN